MTRVARLRARIGAALSSHNALCWLTNCPHLVRYGTDHDDGLLQEPRPCVPVVLGEDYGPGDIVTLTPRLPEGADVICIHATGTWHTFILGPFDCADPTRRQYRRDPSAGPSGRVVLVAHEDQP